MFKQHTLMQCEGEKANKLGGQDVAPEVSSTMSMHSSMVRRTHVINDAYVCTSEVCVLVMQGNMSGTKVQVHSSSLLQRSRRLLFFIFEHAHSVWVMHASCTFQKLSHGLCTSNNLVFNRCCHVWVGVLLKRLVGSNGWCFLLRRFLCVFVLF